MKKYSNSMTKMIFLTGDRIVAINGQSLLNLRYEDALKMLQSSSKTVELVLSQVLSIRDIDEDPIQEPIENNYLQ